MMKSELNVNPGREWDAVARVDSAASDAQRIDWIADRVDLLVANMRGRRSGCFETSTSRSTPPARDDGNELRNLASA
jgi:hypothetical protein